MGKPLDVLGRRPVQSLDGLDDPGVERAPAVAGAGRRRPPRASARA